MPLMPGPFVKNVTVGFVEAGRINRNNEWLSINVDFFPRSRRTQKTSAGI